MSLSGNILKQLCIFDSDCCLRGKSPQKNRYVFGKHPADIIVNIKNTHPVLLPDQWYFNDRSKLSTFI